MWLKDGAHMMGFVPFQEDEKIRAVLPSTGGQNKKLSTNQENAPDIKTTGRLPEFSGFQDYE